MKEKAGRILYTQSFHLLSCGSLSDAVKMKGNTTPSPLWSKPKETRRGGGNHSLSHSKQKETQQGGRKLLLVAFVIFVRSMESRRGKWGGCAAGSSCWSGMRCQILKENTKKTVHLVCPLLLPFSTLRCFVLLSSAICVRRHCWSLVEGG